MEWGREGGKEGKDGGREKCERGGYGDSCTNKYTVASVA